MGQRVPREFVDACKRARCVEAIAESVCEWGAGAVTVQHVTAGAGIARATFYELFRNREEAYEFAVSAAAERLTKAAVSGGAGSGSERLERGLAALLGAVEAAPRQAEMCLVHGSGMSRRTCTPYPAELLVGLTGALERAVPEGDGPGVSSLTSELVACAILAVITQRLRRRDEAAIGDLLAPLWNFTNEALLLPATAAAGVVAE